MLEPQRLGSSSSIRTFCYKYGTSLAGTLHHKRRLYTSYLNDFGATISGLLVLQGTISCVATRHWGET
jgi:hypothetical protein